MESSSTHFGGLSVGLRSISGTPVAYGLNLLALKVRDLLLTYATHRMWSRNRGSNFAWSLERLPVGATRPRSDHIATLRAELLG